MVISDTVFPDLILDRFAVQVVDRTADPECIPLVSRHEFERVPAIVAVTGFDTVTSEFLEGAFCEDGESFSPIPFRL